MFALLALSDDELQTDGRFILEAIAVEVARLPSDGCGSGSLSRIAREQLLAELPAHLLDEVTNLQRLLQAVARSLR